MCCRWKSCQEPFTDNNVSSRLLFLISASQNDIHCHSILDVTFLRTSLFDFLKFIDNMCASMRQENYCEFNISALVRFDYLPYIYYYV